jgi:hypothetical protein
MCKKCIFTDKNMNILITENQYNRLVKEQKEINSKPAVLFDTLYGTNLSQQYDFGDGLTSDDVWDMWVKCRGNGWDGVEDGDCSDMEKLIERLGVIFPYINTGKLDTRQKVEILLGMASEYNPFDIVSFVVHKIYGHNNLEQKRLYKQLPREVENNIQWVLSQHSIDIIRAKFDINEI